MCVCLVFNCGIFFCFILPNENGSRRGSVSTIFTILLLTLLRCLLLVARAGVNITFDVITNKNVCACKVKGVLRQLDHAIIST